MTVAMRVEDMATVEAELAWINVCQLDDIPPASGVAALIGDLQIALVRPGEGETVHALSNFDPFSQAFVIARGIVGDRGGRPKIASPIFKQTFDLETGACFEDPLVKLPIYPVRVRDGRVAIGIAP
jgi:nitrite reductase (NADH) small subunit